MADETQARITPESGNFTSAESHVPAGQGRDAIAQLETRGIDYIPAVERNSRPLNLAWTYFGAQFGYAVYVLGGLLPAFGLGWWASFWAIICGTLIGSLAVASSRLIGPKTGTNSTVSSVASFGVRGRYVGSIIAQFDNLGFNVIIIWRVASPSSRPCTAWPARATEPAPSSSEWRSWRSRCRFWACWVTRA